MAENHCRWLFGFIFVLGLFLVQQKVRFNFFPSIAFIVPISFEARESSALASRYVLE
jgi:hypothetical protein